MAHFQEVDYCSEEVRSVANPAGSFGRHGGGMQQHVVKETFMEESDKGRRHGHGSGHFEVRETKLEEGLNTRTGEFHEHKENIMVRAD